MATGLQPSHLIGRNAELFTGHATIVPVKLKSLNSSMLDVIFDSAGPHAVGIAAEYLNDPHKPLTLTGLALATSHSALVIEINPPNSKSGTAGDDDVEEKVNEIIKKAYDGDEDSEDENQEEKVVHSYQDAVRKLLQGPGRTLVAFSADRLALALHVHLGHRVTNLVDLQSSTEETAALPRSAPNAYINLLGGAENVEIRKLHSLFKDEVQDKIAFHKLAFRAFSAFVAQMHNDIHEKLSDLPKVDTAVLSIEMLSTLSKLFEDKARLEGMKPSYVKTKLDRQLDVENGTITAITNQYRERFRPNSQQKILIYTRDKRYPFEANVESVQGKAVKLRIKCEIGDSKLDVVTMVVTGPEDPPLADKVKAQVILHALQGRGNTFGSPIAKCLWFGQSPSSLTKPHPDFLNEFATGMNDRQRQALSTMLSESDGVQLSVIVGPPGTGKTTVIAACIRALAASNSPVWVVAQSNVGVKNIAARLMKDDFYDWRLLISRDFYQGWNEDLYRDIPPANKIISTDLRRPNRRHQLRGIHVILCTLNLLVHPQLRSAGYIFDVPLRTLIVDEASQIDIGSYLPALECHASIEKICFFGDDKQLAPFGAEQIEGLQSVFELPHLRKAAVFLDTQYRVPAAIADFISREVYDSLLQSRHSNKLRSSCTFIDIVHGEEELFGSSYRNILEARAVKNLVKAAANLDLDFRVITPYEAQRSFVEAMLRGSKSPLPCEDRVFNVDSFQGNEADVIIITLVRTKKTGFLDNLRRINVMLTRCKVAMFICCNMSFLKEAASGTLVGRLVEEWSNADERVIDPLESKKVNWEKLMKNLKSNTLGRKAPANQNGKGKKKPLDYSKVGYGTRIKKKDKGQEKQQLSIVSSGLADNDKLEAQGTDTEAAGGGWGQDTDNGGEWWQDNDSGGWWQDGAENKGGDTDSDSENPADVVDPVDSGWGNDADWEADGWA